jgi:hypothetical protein
MKSCWSWWGLLSDSIGCSLDGVARWPQAAIFIVGERVIPSPHDQPEPAAMPAAIAAPLIWKTAGRRTSIMLSLRSNAATFRPSTGNFR